jgi:hypothetical protein
VGTSGSDEHGLRFVGLAVVLVVGPLLRRTLAGYAVFPDLRNVIAVAGPYLLFLACPLAMFFMMKSMNMQDQEKKPDQDEK